MLFAAWVMAALHVALIAFMLTGSLLALRWPLLLWVHAPVALAVLAVNVTGQPCPITVWELDLLAAAGAPGYPDGFIDRYFLDPFGADVHTTAAQVGIYTVALVPNVVGYGLHARTTPAVQRTVSCARVQISRPARSSASPESNSFSSRRRNC